MLFPLVSPHTYKYGTSFLVTADRIDILKKENLKHSIQIAHI